MLSRELEAAAVEWALDEVEAQLRDEPGSRPSEHDPIHEWSLTAPSGIGVEVEAVRITASSGVATQYDLDARAAGLLPGHAYSERRLTLPD